MDNNWIVENLTNAFGVWNSKMTEMWSLLTESPQTFKGGTIWQTIVTINGGMQAIGYGLLVLFFAIGIFRSASGFRDFQRPEHLLRHFIYFVLAKLGITYGIIVDPEREYGELVRALGGEVITISASDPNGCHINALDLSEGYGDGREPLVMKSEFIMSLYEQLMGADKIEPQEKSIIDRSVGNIYREYLKSYQGQPPTLKDLYDDLMKQVNPEAHRIALALELFTVGSLNVFSHQTNINTKSRILCFDIQDLGENLKSVGLLVMLDAIYNRVIQNRREGKYTHVYIDEIYLFFANGSGSGHSITNYSSEFLYKCWKRFRKYGATLTGITQNVEECLLSNTARMMFANSEFLLMLNQATTDREQLARLLGASDTQMSYVDNAPAGHGLIKVGGAIVPFANELPKNTELYRLMTTKPGED